MPLVYSRCAAIVLTGLAATAATARGQTAIQPVMTGLNDPYGLTFGPDGGLYEAGTGSTGSTAAPTFTGSTGTPVYYGTTGGVSRLLNGTQSRLVTGPPSVAPAAQTEATGLQGLTSDAAGNLYGAFGFGGTQVQRTALVAAGATAAGSFAQVVRLNVTANSATPVSDLPPYETANYAANNSEGQPPEANPYALAALPGGGFAASDGGGNVVLRVPAAGGTPTLLKAASHPRTR